MVGELRTRSYDAKDGTKRYVTEIQADDIEFLAKPGAAGSGASGSYGGGNRGSYGSAPAAAPKDDDLFASEMSDVLVDDEELPF